MKSLVAIFGLLLLIPAAHSVPTPPPNIAVQWDKAALVGISDAKLGAPVVARALAIVHTCMYDAWENTENTGTDGTGTINFCRSNGVSPVCPRIPSVIGFAMLPAINLRTQSYAAQAPPTVEAELRKKRIPLTQAALEEALSDSRPDVRGLAAAELASMKETVSVPLIVKALEEETDQQARFNLASALLELGSQTGNKALSQICVSTSLTNDRRLLAASRLINVGDFSCLASIESILRETTNPSEKSSALLLLTQVKPLPASLTPRIHNTLVASLKDPNSAVRHYAGQCIAALGDRHAETDLKAAIATEKDDQTRERLMQSLAGLEGKP